MHRSITFLVNIFFAVLSFLMLGNIAGAVSLPEQRLVAKRKPTSTTGGQLHPPRRHQAAAPAAANRRDFLAPGAFIADCPPHPLPSNRCTQTCGANEIAKQDGSCSCPSENGYYYNDAGYCGLENGAYCQIDAQCQTRNCQIFSDDGQGNVQGRCRSTQQGE